MIIYFLSALLIAAVLYKLGSYAMLFSLLVSAGQSIAFSAVLAVLVLLWKRYKRKKQKVKLIGRS